MTAVALITFLFGAGIFLIISTTQQVDTSKHNILSHAASVATHIYNKSSWQQLENILILNPEVSFLKLYDSNKNLVHFYQSFDVVSQEKLSTIELFKQFEQLTGETITVNITDGNLIASRKIIIDNTTYYLAIISDLSTVKDSLRSNIEFLIIMSFVILFFCIIFSKKISIHILQSINHLIEAMKSISYKEDYSVKVFTHSNDEVGVLVENFNAMIQAIQVKNTTIKDMNQLLEHKNEDLLLTNIELKQTTRACKLFYAVANLNIIGQTELNIIQNYTREVAQISQWPIAHILYVDENLNKTTITQISHLFITEEKNNTLSKEPLTELSNDENIKMLAEQALKNKSTILTDKEINHTIQSLLALPLFVDGGIRYVIVFSVNTPDNADENLIHTINTSAIQFGNLLDKITLSQAKIASQQKSAFLANMSHELRTPISGINGILELLQVSDVNSLQKKYIELAIQSTDHMVHVINDILDFSQIEAGKLMINIVPINMRNEIQYIESFFKPNSDGNNIKFDVSIAKNIPAEIHSDEKRITQVLLNLLSNAFKFTDKGGLIKLTVFLNDIDPEKLFFSIEDNGSGIPEKDLKLIFEAFKQSDTNISNTSIGSGLGLSISKHLVKLLGGDIKVHSKPGQGSTFDFSIKMHPIIDKVSII